MKRKPLFILAFLGLIIMSSCSSTKGTDLNRMVATMQIEEPIEGVCDNSQLFVMLPIEGNGQVNAKAPMTDEEIENELNKRVSFLKDKPDYNDEGMVNLIINCKGELVQCEIDNKTKSPELDDQVVAVFADLKNWEAGTINGKPVDTAELYSFKIKNGKISL